MAVRTVTFQGSPLTPRGPGDPPGAGRPRRQVADQRPEGFQAQQPEGEDRGPLGRAEPRHERLRRADAAFQTPRRLRWPRTSWCWGSAWTCPSPRGDGAGRRASTASRRSATTGQGISARPMAWLIEELRLLARAVFVVDGRGRRPLCAGRPRDDGSPRLRRRDRHGPQDQRGIADPPTDPPGAPIMIRRSLRRALRERHWRSFTERNQDAKRHHADRTERSDQRRDVLQLPLPPDVGLAGRAELQGDGPLDGHPGPGRDDPRDEVLPLPPGPRRGRHAQGDRRATDELGRGRWRSSRPRWSTSSTSPGGSTS